MMYYIAIDKINGRQEFFNLAADLDVRGYDDRVEYFGGGWDDMEISTVLPHLRFLREDDALAYVLTYGGHIVTEVPTQQRAQVKSQQ